MFHLAFRVLLASVFVAYLSIGLVHAQSENSVVVIPLFGDDLLPIKNVITVSKRGGEFKSPASAIESISDAGSDNPYLVLIAPGNYLQTEPLQLKPYVHVVGSGEGVTVLRGSISGFILGESAMVVTSRHSSIRDLTIENTGGGISRSIGILNDSAEANISNLSIVMNGTGGVGEKYGMLVQSSPAPEISGVTIDMKYGAVLPNNRVYGIKNNFSSPRISRTNIHIELDESIGGTIFGIHNTSYSNTIVDTTISIVFPGNSSGKRGINNTMGSTPTLRRVTYTGGGFAVLHDTAADYSIIEFSLLQGQVRSSTPVSFSDPISKLYHSTIEIYSGGQARCVLTSSFSAERGRDCR